MVKQRGLRLCCIISKYTADVSKSFWNYPRHLKGANCLIEVIRECRNMENASVFEELLLFLIQMVTNQPSCAESSHSILKLFFLPLLLFFWRRSQSGSFYFSVISFSLPYLWISLSPDSLVALSLSLSFCPFFSSNLSFQEYQRTSFFPSPSTLSCKCLSTEEAFRKKKKSGRIKAGIK